MEARATHIGPDRDKKEKANSVLRQTSQNFSRTPQHIQICIIFLAAQDLAQAFRVNKTNLDKKPPRVMDEGIFREGRNEM